MARRGPLLEAFGVYVAVTLAVVALARALALPARAPIAPFEASAIGALLMAVTLWLARRSGRGVRAFGVHLGGLLEPTDPSDPRPAGPLGVLDLARAARAAAPHAAREAAVTCAVAAVVFPPFSLAYAVWHGLPPGDFHFGGPPDLLAVAFTQWVVVAIPEEAFFRGYLQTRLSEAWPAGVTPWGAPISVRALLAQAALFALMHFAVEPRPERLAVFFPALLFGWLRARRGGIGAASGVHALSNVLARVLAFGWP